MAVIDLSSTSQQIRSAIDVRAHHPTSLAADCKVRQTFISAFAVESKPQAFMPTVE